MIAQCKGKDLKNVPTSKLDIGTYYTSRKYDGNYVQIHKIGNDLTFYSSGGIPFKLESIQDQILSENKDIDFVLEAEYIGLTDGSLGSRGDCTTTTFRTKSKKGIRNETVGIKFMVFDCLYYHEHKYIDLGDFFSLNYGLRLDELVKINLGDSLKLVNIYKMTLEEAIELAKACCKDYNYEGLFCKKESHLVRPGKRVNDAIKLKFYEEATLRCIDVKYGTGQFAGIVSSLVLYKDEITVDVGGVIVGRMGIKDKTYFTGRDFTIIYEHFNKTYIQPRFKDKEL